MNNVIGTIQEQKFMGFEESGMMARNVMSQILKGVDASKVLRTVPFENGFHFCTNVGVYTNVAATSLMDFAAKLDSVDVFSVEFHYPRGDFQFWITKTLGDEELGNRLCLIKKGLHWEQLRDELLRLVKERIRELCGSSENEEESDLS
jgi:hypothetical protein